MSTIQPLFAPRIAGEFLYGEGPIGGRWCRISYITSFLISGAEIIFRINDEDESGYVCARLPGKQQADKELFELLLMIDPATAAQEE